MSKGVSKMNRIVLSGIVLLSMLVLFTACGGPSEMESDYNDSIRETYTIGNLEYNLPNSGEWSAFQGSAMPDEIWVVYKAEPVIEDGVEYKGSDGLVNILFRYHGRYEDIVTAIVEDVPGFFSEGDSEKIEMPESDSALYKESETDFGYSHLYYFQIGKDVYSAIAYEKVENGKSYYDDAVIDDIVRSYSIK